MTCRSEPAPSESAPLNTHLCCTHTKLQLAELAFPTHSQSWCGERNRYALLQTAAPHISLVAHAVLVQNQILDHETRMIKIIMASRITGLHWQEVERSRTAVASRNQISMLGCVLAECAKRRRHNAEPLVRPRGGLSCHVAAAHHKPLTNMPESAMKAA